MVSFLISTKRYSANGDNLDDVYLGADQLPDSIKFPKEPSTSIKG